MKKAKAEGSFANNNHRLTSFHIVIYLFYMTAVFMKHVPLLYMIIVEERAYLNLEFQILNDDDEEFRVVLSNKGTSLVISYSLEIFRLV